MTTDTDCEKTIDYMEVWHKLRTPPQEALTEIGGGRLKGMTDISPMWRIKVMTETFGMCGIGWKYTIDKQWVEDGSENQVTCFTNISLYVWVDNENSQSKWSDAIPGTGGSMLVEKERNGPHTSDECFKMSLTDSLSVAMKALGVGADIYMGGKGGNQSKHDKANKTPDCPKCKKNVTVFEDKNTPNSFYCWKKKEGCGHKWAAKPEPPSQEAKKNTADKLASFVEELDKQKSRAEVIKFAESKQVEMAALKIENETLYNKMRQQTKMYIDMWQDKES